MRLFRAKSVRQEDEIVNLYELSGVSTVNVPVQEPGILFRAIGLDESTTLLQFLRTLLKMQRLVKDGTFTYRGISMSVL